MWAPRCTQGSHEHCCAVGMYAHLSSWELLALGKQDLAGHICFGNHGERSGIVRCAPPAFIGIAGHDPIRDDGAIYAERLAAAGVPVELNRADTLIHGYAYFADVIPAATETVDAGIKGLKAALQ